MRIYLVDKFSYSYSLSLVVLLLKRPLMPNHFHQWMNPIMSYIIYFDNKENPKNIITSKEHISSTGICPSALKMKLVNWLCHLIHDLIIPETLYWNTLFIKLTNFSNFRRAIENLPSFLFWINNSVKNVLTSGGNVTILFDICLSARTFFHILLYPDMH